MQLLSPTRSICSAAFALTLATLSVSLAHAQSAETDTTSPAVPVSQPQYSTITSTNNTIEATRIPVSYNGKLYYEDLTFGLDFSVSSTGVVTVEVSPKLATSANPASGGFKAGTYMGPADVNGGKSIILVTGPSELPGGGSEWSLAMTSAASTSTFPSSGYWYVESIANSPLASRLKSAGITSAQMYYGVGDSGSFWCNNSLLGFNQVGNTIVISDFTSNAYGCPDQSTPADTITYTLQQ